MSYRRRPNRYDFLFDVVVTSLPAVRPITVARNKAAGSHIVEGNVHMAV
jgi:hypothetical protein